MNHKEYLEWVRQSYRKMDPPKIIHDPDGLTRASITETCHPTDTFCITAPADLPEVQLLPKRFKSKCKRHRREARGW